MTYLQARITGIPRSALPGRNLTAAFEDGIKCFDLATLISVVSK
jgi:hypothetical protein